MPTEIGSQLGEERYAEAVAGAHRNKYYLCMKDSEGKKNLFVYDTAKGLWHKEDDEDIAHFCTSRDEMYYIADGKIKKHGKKEEVLPELLAQTAARGLCVKFTDGGKN